MTGSLLAVLGALGHWSVVLLMVLTFAETGILVGFLLPGDSLLFGAGVLVAAGGMGLPLWLTILAVTVAATAGNQVGYAVGRRYGPRVLHRPSSRLLTPRHLQRARVFVERHGPRAVLLSRFVPFARTLTPVIAGVGEMPRRRFLTYNLVGAAVWSAVMLGGGYLLGGVPFIAGHLELIMLGMIGVALLPGPAALRPTRSRADVAVAQVG